MSRIEDISIPAARRVPFAKITFLTDAFCAKYLDEEYAEVCRFMTMDLCRLQPSPLDTGRVQTWAAGIIFTVGSLNFLNDPAFEPYLSTAGLARRVKVSEGTLYNKRKQIEKSLELMPFDPDYTVPSMLEVNPLMWMVEVDGFPMDLRDAPREMQLEAYEQGLIPYLPPLPWDDADEYDEEDDLASPRTPAEQGDAKIIKFPGPKGQEDFANRSAKRKNTEPTLFDE